MKNIANIEVYHIETTDKGTFAHISYQDLTDRDSPTDGYNHVVVPVNVRPIQVSSRGNTLVDQSVKNYETAACAN